MAHYFENPAKYYLAAFILFGVIGGAVYSAHELTAAHYELKGRDDQIAVALDRVRQVEQERDQALVEIASLKTALDAGSKHEAQLQQQIDSLINRSQRQVVQEANSSPTSIGVGNPIQMPFSFACLETNNGDICVIPMSIAIGMYLLGLALVVGFVVVLWHNHYDHRKTSIKFSNLEKALLSAGHVLAQTRERYQRALNAESNKVLELQNQMTLLAHLPRNGIANRNGNGNGKHHKASVS